MPRKTLITLGLCIVMGMLTATVQAQEPTSTPALAPRAMAAGFSDLSFWVALAATIIAGAVGGVVYELVVLQGAIEVPHRFTAEEATEKAPYAVARYMVDLGIWARIIIGGLAAVAALLVLKPDSAFALLATALVAGSAGTSVFRSMQDRLSTQLAQKDAADTRAMADDMADKVDEARAALGDLKQALSLSAPSRDGSRDISDATDASARLEELDRIAQLLSEAKGLRGGR